MADTITKRYLDLEGLTLYDQRIKALIKAVDDKVGDVSAITSDTVTTLAQAIQAEVVRASGVEAEQKALIDILVGDDAQKSIREIATLVLAEKLIPEDAKKSLDTLEEIAAWIQSHPDDAAALNEAIQALEKELGDPAVEAKEAVTHEATEEDVAAGLAEEVGEIIIDEPAVEGKSATGIYKIIEDNKKVTDIRLDAIEQALGLKDPEVEGDKSLAEKVGELETAVEDINDEIDALKAVEFVAITADEINALFDTPVTNPEENTSPEEPAEDEEEIPTEEVTE